MAIANVKWLAVFAVLVTVTAAQQSKPNLVFMLVDDCGWASVGYLHDPPLKEVVTPNIDALVKEGLELDQHYAFKLCSPSRSCLMSGRLQFMSMMLMLNQTFTILKIQYLHGLDLLVYLET